MNWLFPGFLAGLLAIALPIALHFLRRQPKRTIVFPSLRFLAVATQKSERRHRLLRLLVLALRCAAFALLAAAFARPFFAANDLRSGKAIVVVVDNTFSLQAKGRWVRLLAWTRQQIGPRGPGDKLGILLLAPRPTWVAGLTSDTASVVEKLLQLQPGWQTGRAEPALRLAADTLSAAGGAERQIIYLGDHQRVSWLGADFSKPLPAGVAVAFPPVAEPIARQAALNAPTLTRTERGIHVALSVRNFSGVQSRKLRVYRDGETTALAEKSLDLGEHETRIVDFELPASAPGSARFRFALDADDLPADDTVYAVWQTGVENTVLLDPAPAGSEADFVAAALNSTTSIKPSLHVLPTPTGVWPSNTVAVLRNPASFTGPAGARLDKYLRDGGSVLAFLNGDGSQQKWLAATRRITVHPATAENKSPLVHDWAMDHPIVAAMSEHEVSPLLGWNFRQGWALPTDTVEPLALWSENEAAIGEVKVGAGRLLLCGFSPDRRSGEWPVHPAFVPFLHRAIAYLLGTQTTEVAVPDKVGMALRLPAATGTWQALDGPAVGQPARLVSNSVVPSEPGVYEFVGSGERKLFAVNVAADESDPAGWTEDKPWLGLISRNDSAKVADQLRFDLPALEAEQRSSLWWWLLAAVSVLLLLELGLANRTAR